MQLPTLIQVFLLAYILWSFLEVVMKCRHPRAQVPFYLLMLWYVVIFYTVVDYQIYGWSILYRGNAFVNGAGIALFLAASGLRFMGIRTLRRHDDHDEPVTEGLFGIVRHPLWTAYLLQLTGIVVCFGSWGSMLGLILVCIPLIILNIRSIERVVPFEYEKEEAAYRAAVRARLVPGIW